MPAASIAHLPDILNSLNSNHYAFIVAVIIALAVLAYKLFPKSMEKLRSAAALMIVGTLCIIAISQLIIPSVPPASSVSLEGSRKPLKEPKEPLKEPKKPLEEPKKPLEEPKKPFEEPKEPLKMIKIPSSKDLKFEMGSFEMGSNDIPMKGQPQELPIHPVRVKTFFLSETEITQDQWRKVMGGNPSKSSICGDCPVESVSWDDAKKFIEKLNSTSKNNYRLPTEAEWEYACRGNRKYKYCGSDNADKVAWYAGNSNEKTHPVKKIKKANIFGLYGMSGNVSEWVEDCHHDNYNGAPKDGSAWISENPGGCKHRMIRGGSWHDGLKYLRSTSRYSYPQDNNGNASLGFRIARDMP